MNTGHGPTDRPADYISGLIDPSRIAMARELRELTRQELADRTDGAVSPSTLGQIEKGHTAPSAATIEAVATATGCPPEFFLRRPGDLPHPGFLRSTRSAPAKARRRQIARARLLHDLVQEMEEHLRLPETNLPLLEAPLGRRFDTEQAAEDLRAYWKVEPGPIPNVVRLLERNGLVVVRVKTFVSDIDAFSVFFDDRPVIVLGSDKGVTARSRFDAAHELGHVLLHRNTSPEVPGVEDQAQEFAAAFLMPASMIRNQLPRTADWSELMNLKARWRVSMQALLRRALTLEVMSQKQYDNARKAMSARGWLRDEPGDERLGAVESPVMLERALEQLDLMGYPLERMAKEAALPLYDLNEIRARTTPERPALII